MGINLRSSQEYANLKFKDGEAVEDFSLRLQTLISKLRSHSVTIEEEEVVSKYLHSVLVKYIQIALSIEMMLDLSTLTIEDVTCHLWVVDERMEQAIAMMNNSMLLLIEEWAAWKKSGEASSSHGGDGKHRGKASLKKKKKKVDPNVRRRCGKKGYWAKECPNHKQEKKV